ncbi:hypothetical protein FDK21_18940 [Cohaesibacter sp. CAU 1516]|uniref:hypothetical protein n=1 Tax=Cohaesibacter sp. CAU 1516 TaxID=2576038 RepID=UPI0010FD54C3|nr:hypothetical protein [Cohaesibacter sp. CAU 1516]TLP42903.1 hypothetical protein FDK21_18940 [Cohaesibacter sp. CAU 1516]
MSIKSALRLIAVIGLCAMGTLLPSVASQAEILTAKEKAVRRLCGTLSPSAVYGAASLSIVDPSLRAQMHGSDRQFTALIQCSNALAQAACSKDYQRVFSLLLDEFTGLSLVDQGPPSKATIGCGLVAAAAGFAKQGKLGDAKAWGHNAAKACKYLVKGWKILSCESRRQRVYDVSRQMRWPLNFEHVYMVTVDAIDVIEATNMPNDTRQLMHTEMATRRALLEKVLQTDQ